MLDIDVKELLSYIDPSTLNYSEWCQVGMALEHEGYSWTIWDEWSRADSKRYHSGECEKKWQTFKGASSPVTGGTLIALAQENGWYPKHDNDEGYELEWDSVIGGKRDDYKIIDKSWLESQELSHTNMPPTTQIIKYLETLFDVSENVGYVVSTWEKDGKQLPNKGNYDRTAGELIEALSSCNGDIGAVFGDTNEKAGAWIRFNPLDGKGVKNDNVTEYTVFDIPQEDIQKRAYIPKMEVFSNGE